MGCSHRFWRRRFPPVSFFQMTVEIKVIFMQRSGKKSHRYPKQKNPLPSPGNSKLSVLRCSGEAITSRILPIPVTNYTLYARNRRAPYQTCNVQIPPTFRQEYTASIFKSTSNLPLWGRPQSHRCPRQNIHCHYRFAILIQPYIKCLDAGRIVHQDYRFFEMFSSTKYRFMFAHQIHSQPVIGYWNFFFLLWLLFVQECL